MIRFKVVMAVGNPQSHNYPDDTIPTSLELEQKKVSLYTEYPLCAPRNPTL